MSKSCPPPSDSQGNQQYIPIAANFPGICTHFQALFNPIHEFLINWSIPRDNYPSKFRNGENFIWKRNEYLSYQGGNTSNL